MSYSAIIEAISKDMQHRHALTNMSSANDTGAIAGEIIAHQQRMPDYLQFPMRVLTWGFDLWGLVKNGTRFQKMDAAKRAVQIDSWKNSPLGFCRNFVRFYESMFLLIALQEEHE